METYHQLTYQKFMKVKIRPLIDGTDNYVAHITFERITLKSDH